MPTEELLTKINKKLDKLLNLNTKIAKCLHLLPVTEKEERDIQILQRTNLQIAAKINDELNEMQPKKEESFSPTDIYSKSYTDLELFGDVIADDLLET